MPLFVYSLVSNNYVAKMFSTPKIKIVFLNGPIPAPFSVYFRLFNTLQFKLKKAQMVCLGFELGAMEGVNESTELRRKLGNFKLRLIKLYS